MGLNHMNSIKWLKRGLKHQCNSGPRTL
uniref:Uncharacterized protein n=1 Tax=Arundo donax TaxID=35708 RepID=A0A0A9A310_ARUDO